MADVEISEEQYAADYAKKQTTVKSLLKSGDKKGALEAALRKAPLGSKSVEVKDGTADLVGMVLKEVGESEVNGLIAPLDMDLCDVLMKYVYKVMGMVDKGTNYGVCLKLHALLTEKAGMGSIIRAVTDRRTV